MYPEQGKKSFTLLLLYPLNHILTMSREIASPSIVLPGILAKAVLGYPNSIEASF